MVLYINGDSHSAGAEAVVPFAFAEDDPWRYPPPNRSPHPDNVVASFGNLLANKLGWDAVNHSESASSNDRIIRTTEDWLATNPTPNLVLIGWSTWEREEWIGQDKNYYQVNASGVDTVPADLKDKYKHWVIEQSSPERHRDIEFYWHNRIWEWHLSLEQRKIPHLFFNTYLYFNNIVAHSIPRFDWGTSYIGPYNEGLTYYTWLKNHGINTVNPNSYHFGVEGHKLWSELLTQFIESNG
jgi:hypothetical protein